MEEKRYFLVATKSPQEPPCARAQTPRPAFETAGQQLLGWSANTGLLSSLS